VRIQTREAGPVEINPEDVIEFSSPIIGFEKFRRFVIVPAPDAPPFHWLQSLEELQIAFPLVSASELGVAYTVSSHVAGKLGATSHNELEFWVIVTIPVGQGQTRVNLRAPIVVNRRDRTAAQIVMHDDYPIRRSLTAAGTS